MRTLYYDCFAGISGDMNLAAMIDLGADKDRLVGELEKLGLKGWRIETKRDARMGISGTLANVVCEDAHGEHGHSHGHAHGEGHGGHSHGGHGHRTFSEIKRIISASPLSAYVKEKSIAIFSTIAEAEAEVHGKSPDEVHFHEVGALDSIIDIVGAAICAEMLGIDAFASSPVELGGGTVRCQHGLMPVPAPATAIIAKSFPSKLGGAMHECTTPTGAAIIATLCGAYSPKISGRIIASGIGVGHRDSPELPNVLRAMIIEENGESGSLEQMFEISANIDDMTPEDLSLLTDRLFEAGCADVWQESIVMKKNRLAAKVTALAEAAAAPAAREAFFRHSSTLGLRQNAVERHSLSRESQTVSTSFGEVRFKVCRAGGTTRAKPEFDDCKRISEETGIPSATIRAKLADEFKGGQA